MPDLLFFLLGLFITLITITGAYLVARGEAEASEARARALEERESRIRSVD
jgi:hypothetical protein